MKLLHKILILVIIISITACDGYRVVRLTNLSDSDIYLETDYPHKVEYHQDIKNKKEYKEILNYQWGEYFMRMNRDIEIDSISNGFRVLLKPKQSFSLLNGIGSVIGKIKPQELYFSKLKVYTPNDTIVANDRAEILSLAEAQKTKYNEEADKILITRNNDRWRNIIIRE